MRRLLNHARRAIFSDRHKELTKWDEIKFVYEIIRRMFSHDPKIREFVKKNYAKVVILRTYEEADQYVDALG